CRRLENERRGNMLCSLPRVSCLEVDTPLIQRKVRQPEALLIQPLLLPPPTGCGEDSALATRSDPRSARILPDLDTRRTSSGSNCRPAYFSSSSIAVVSVSAFR